MDALCRTIAAPAAEDKQMPAMRIEPQDLLHLQRKAIEALAHVGVTGGEPNPRPRRERDHRRRRGAITAPIAADTAAGSTVPLILTLVPPRSAILIEPVGGPTSSGGDPPRCSAIEVLAGAISTSSSRDGSAPGAAAGTASCRRHLNSWFVFTS